MAQTNMNEQRDVVIVMPSPIKNEIVSPKSRFSQCTQRLKKYKKTTLFGIVFAIFSLVATLVSIFFIVKHHQRTSPAPSEDDAPNGLSKDLDAAHALQQTETDEEKQRAEKLEKKRQRVQQLPAGNAKQDLINDKCRLPDTVCNLRGQNIFSIDNIKWPPHIEHLDLGNNEIKKLSQDDVSALPDGLVGLVLDDNEGLRFDDVPQFPLELQSLALNGIGLSCQALNNLNLSECSKLRQLFISNNHVVFNEPSEIPAFPKSLIYIELDCSTWESLMDVLPSSECEKILPNLKCVTTKNTKSKRIL